MDNQENLAVIGQPVMPALPVVDQRAFTLEDILWSIGIWSVLLTMSPVIIFGTPSARWRPECGSNAVRITSARSRGASHPSICRSAPPTDPDKLRYGCGC